MPTELTKPCFACPHCTKEFVRIGQFNKHKLLCEMMNKTDAEIRHDVDDLQAMPSTIDMYRMLHILTQKYVKLEKKVGILEKENNRLRKRTKISMVAFLNQHYNIKTTFDDMFEIFNTKCDIKELFESTLFEVIKALIDNYICNMKQYPIIHFKNFNTQCMYVYKNNAWEVCNVSYIVNGCKSIERNLFKQLNAWQSAASLDNDGNVSLFTETAMKLVSNDNNVYQMIRKYMIDVFTMDIKQIYNNSDEYEITH